jgi:hypothetical protein
LEPEKMLARKLNEKTPASFAPAGVSEILGLSDPLRRVHAYADYAYYDDVDGGGKNAAHGRCDPVSQSKK